MKKAKRKQPGEITAVDLFAGAGGLSEGLRQAGYRVVGAVELNSVACATYRSNHKDVVLLESDIRSVTGPALLKKLGLKRGQLGLLASCPPCQGFSTMRTRNGSKGNRDSRNDLVFDVLRLIRSMRPVRVMMENVPGLAENRRFKEFCDGLIAAGYKIRAEVLNTVDYGVPQRRRRLVLLASLKEVPRFASKCRRVRTVRDAIDKVPPTKRSRDPLHNYTPRVSEKVRQLIRAIPQNGGSRDALSIEHQLKCHRKTDGFKDVYGRMHWDSAAPTITGGCINPSKGRFLHPRAHRAITLREAALLQTFPKRYRFSLDGGRYAAALLIGNALPPEFIRRHALALKTTLERRR